MRSIPTIALLEYLIFVAYRTCHALIDYSSVREEDSLFLKAKHNTEVYKDDQTVGWAFSFSTSIQGKCAGSCHNNAQCRSSTLYKDTGICELQDINRLSPNANIVTSPQKDNIEFFEKRRPPLSKILLQKYVKDAADCMDIYEKGHKTNGVYYIGSDDGAKKSILCDMEIAGQLFILLFFLKHIFYS